MRQVIVAFENGANCVKIREIIESGSGLTCLVCHSAAQVKRAVRKLRLDVVVCGFKLSDESCEALYYDLPERCSMLMIAPQAQLELCEAEGILKLQAPIRRGELLASVRMLAQLSRMGGEDRSPVRRSQEEQELVAQAKVVLMDRHGMTEEQAHRFLQKRSMDSCSKLADTAQLVLSDQ